MQFVLENQVRFKNFKHNKQIYRERHEINKKSLDSRSFQIENAKFRWKSRKFYLTFSLSSKSVLFFLFFSFNVKTITITNVLPPPPIPQKIFL